MTLTTKPSTPESLVPGARHAVAPKGIESSAWPRVKGTCRNIGWRFDPWQDAVGRLILAKRADGGWASDLSILSIPRQVGKSYLLGCIIFALCLLNPKLRVIWTSHHTATTEEMYEAMKELAQNKRVAPHVKKCIALQGSRWRIIFANGSRIDFGARERGFGRGKARVGVLVLDEFQHITMRALSNLTPTTNTAENPLILCAGTPPAPHDNAEAFSMRRKAALEGISADTLYVEFGADKGAELDDRRQWAKANPSFPKRTPERAFLLNRKVLDDESFRREFLGIWDEDAGQESVFDMRAWGALLDRDAPQPAGAVLAVDVAPDRKWSSIGVAAGLPDGRTLVLTQTKRGTEWVVPALVSLRTERRIDEISLHPGQALMLKPALLEARIPFVELANKELGQACAQFQEWVAEKRLVHVGQPELDAAVRNARTRYVGTSEVEHWDRRDHAVDISPLVACSLAAHRASLTGPSVYESRGLVTL
jgi:phage terminase large subunit-like protein